MHDIATFTHLTAHPIPICKPVNQWSDKQNLEAMVFWGAGSGSLIFEILAFLFRSDRPGHST